MWDIASVFAKVFSLLGIATVVGGVFSLYLTRRLEKAATQQIKTYMIAGSALGFGATAAFFSIQVGSINQRGLGGMMDWQMGQILAQSSLGYSTIIRLGAFLLTTCAVQLFVTSPEESDKGLRQRSSQLLFMFAICGLAYSFLLTGHVTSQGPAAHLALALHIIMVFLWIGTLWPLHSICTLLSEDTEALRSVMAEFGNLAMGIVSILIFCGMFFLYSLLESWREIYTTPYGRGMLVKFAAVSVLILFGAINKLRLVPELKAPFGSISLARSIKIEMTLAVFIFAVTSYLTVIIGN